MKTLPEQKPKLSLADNFDQRINKLKDLALVLTKKFEEASWLEEFSDELTEEARARVLKTLTSTLSELLGVEEKIHEMQNRAAPAPLIIINGVDED
jgi:hypothetical protein